MNSKPTSYTCEMIINNHEYQSIYVVIDQQKNSVIFSDIEYTFERNNMYVILHQVILICHMNAYKCIQFIWNSLCQIIKIISQVQYIIKLIKFNAYKN